MKQKRITKKLIIYGNGYRQTFRKEMTGDGLGDILAAIFKGSAKFISRSGVLPAFRRVISKAAASAADAASKYAAEAAPSVISAGKKVASSALEGATESLVRNIPKYFEGSKTGSDVLKAARDETLQTIIDTGTPLAKDEIQKLRDAVANQTDVLIREAQADARKEGKQVKSNIEKELKKLKRRVVGAGMKTKTKKSKK
jgi:hypothetical protein